MCVCENRQPGDKVCWKEAAVLHSSTVPSDRNGCERECKARIQEVMEQEIFNYLVYD